MKSNVIWSPKTSEIKSFYIDTRFTIPSDFRELILSHLNLGTTYSVLIRVEYDNGKYGMLGPQIGLQLDISDYEETIQLLFENIFSRLVNFSDYYHVVSLDSAQILFVKVNTQPSLRLPNIKDINITNKGLNSKDVKQKYRTKFLPLTTNINYFGKIIGYSESKKYINKINVQKKLLAKSPISYEDYDNMFIYNNYIILNKIKENKDHLLHKLHANNEIIREVYDVKLGTLEAVFIDTLLPDNKFKRMYRDVVFTISENEIEDVSVSKELPIIKYEERKSLLRNDTLVSNPNIGVFDLEAFRLDETTAKPYAVGYCVLNQAPKIFYLDNLKEDILLNCLNSMLVSKYHNYKFYVHNLNYDGIFIINKLKSVNVSKGFEYYKVNAFYRDNSILKIEVSIVRNTKFVEDNKNKDNNSGNKSKNNKIKNKDNNSGNKSKTNNLKDKNKVRNIKIIFVDSSNMLKGKLQTLCKAFGLSESEGKGYFPYNFVNSNNLHYVGNTPSLRYWENIPLDEYNKLLKSDWNLKNECILYLKQDLVSLLKIMQLFTKYIKQKFDIQVTECLTISRLSLNIYLKYYLKNHKIPLIKGNMYDDIKQAYYGGVTEVYRPYGKNLFYYDVNSLYPFVALNPMCSNKYTYKETLNNTGLNLDNLFGFFYCEIEAKDNYLGLLPVRRIEGLVMPIGKWSGWYFSEELKFASENGYKIKVIKGYNFEKEYNVFDDYIKVLYEIKSTTTNKVERSVAKSLLNNLLGRFGLNILKPITEIVNKETLDFILTTRECNSFKKITDWDYLISYNPKVFKEICELHGLDYFKVLQKIGSNYNKNLEFKDVSIVISAAITSYARIYMSKIKLDVLNKGNKIFYTDTDSLVTDVTLNEKLVGNDLGLFKLEYEIKEGFFISSKTYSLILKDNSNVIKTKGILNESLTIEDFIYLYQGYNVKGLKRSANTNYFKGCVVINDASTWINQDSYKKRIKLFDKEGLWIDTKPIYIEGIPVFVNSKTCTSLILISKSREFIFYNTCSTDFIWYNSCTKDFVLHKFYMYSTSLPVINTFYQEKSSTLYVRAISIWYKPIINMIILQPRAISIWYKPIINMIILQPRAISLWYKPITNMISLWYKPVTNMIILQSKEIIIRTIPKTGLFRYKDIYHEVSNYLIDLNHFDRQVLPIMSYVTGESRADGWLFFNSVDKVTYTKWKSYPFWEKDRYASYLTHSDLPSKRLSELEKYVNYSINMCNSMVCNHPLVFNIPRNQKNKNKKKIKKNKICGVPTKKINKKFLISLRNRRFQFSQKKLKEWEESNRKRKLFIAHQVTKNKRLLKLNKFCIYFLNSKSSIIKKWLSKFVSILIDLCLIVLSFILISLLGGFIDYDINNDLINNELINNDLINIEYNEYEFNKVNFKSISIEKPKIQIFKDSYCKELYNNSLNIILYENILQKAISECIITNYKFSGINSLLNYCQSYTDDQIEFGKLKLTTTEYLKLMCRINEIKYNKPLYNLICIENNKIDLSIKHNITPQRFIENYHKWVINPNTEQIPKDLNLKNKLSLLEELELINEKSTNIKDIDKITKYFESIRKINHKPK